MTVHPPVYIAGYQSFSTQSPQQFNSIYPKVNNISSIGVTGNGTTGPFTGVINSQQAIILPNVNQQQIGLLQGQVLFSAIGDTGTGSTTGMAMADVPLVDTATGYKLNFGNLYNVNSADYKAALANPPTTIADANNVINYLTGDFSVQFPYNTIVGTQITSQTVPQVLSLPQALLYYSNTFTLRPVPDQSYRVNFEVYQRPTALLSAGQYPELEEYWQYIAYGAAKKIFEDRMDLESVALILPEYRKQENLCLRRTIVQYTNERTATIYTEQTSYGAGSGAWGWGGGSF